ncbi:hypothetical protein HanRHA438_Chr17g0837931 [Helianthus annuus]|nr:hypothetical protein HanIR_Chr17g0898661 [Helianthus annuus]KAJ0449318.1 hypothetical protein HanHA89_Chr17g0727101 [Helianthus annuus]KAJ0828501.1 hypothetical protein HanRHA438_Chr17g0837931 [Helianthus annuus]
MFNNGRELVSEINGITSGNSTRSRYKSYSAKLHSHANKAMVLKHHRMQLVKYIKTPFFIMWHMIHGRFNMNNGNISNNDIYIG